MAEISVDIGGRNYQVACRDGGENQLRKVAAMVDERADRISSAVGNLTESRQLLMVALVLADELTEARNGTGAAPAPSPYAPEGDGIRNIAAVERLAERVETLAAQLEKLATNP